MLKGNIGLKYEFPMRNIPLRPHIALQYRVLKTLKQYDHLEGTARHTVMLTVGGTF